VRFWGGSGAENNEALVFLIEFDLGRGRPFDQGVLFRPSLSRSVKLFKIAKLALQGR